MPEQSSHTPAPAAPQRFTGCLLGGAVGDALGAPVEFMRRAEILDRFGPQGITRYAPAYGGTGMITDDTQMTLFTAEGLLRAWVRGCMRGISTYSGVTAHAYLRWLQTQGERPACDIVSGQENPGWLFGHKALHHRRAPGNTCLAALREMKFLGDAAVNDSKGCGGVMRVAPVGLFAWRLKRQDGQAEAFRLATELAALTHGHPSGSLSAGALAVMIFVLADGGTLPAALDAARACLRKRERHEETLHAIDQAQALARQGCRMKQRLPVLGKAGWRKRRWRLRCTARWWRGIFGKG